MSKVVIAGEVGMAEPPFIKYLSPAWHPKNGLWVGGFNVFPAVPTPAR